MADGVKVRGSVVVVSSANKQLSLDKEWVYDRQSPFILAGVHSTLLYSADLMTSPQETDFNRLSQGVLLPCGCQLLQVLFIQWEVIGRGQGVREEENEVSSFSARLHQ